MQSWNDERVQRAIREASDAGVESSAITSVIFNAVDRSDWPSGGCTSSDELLAGAKHVSDPDVQVGDIVRFK